jgi:hypothetical protein
MSDEDVGRQILGIFMRYRIVLQPAAEQPEVVTMAPDVTDPVAGDEAPTVPGSSDPFKSPA